MTKAQITCKNTYNEVGKKREQRMNYNIYKLLLFGGYVVLPIMFSSLRNILLSTTNSRGSSAVPSTEPALIIFLSFLESLALMLLPLQMASKRIALATTDCQKTRNLLRQTLNDLSFLKKLCALSLPTDSLSVTCLVQSVVQVKAQISVALSL